MSDDSMKTAAFHENRTKDHQLPGMVTLCYWEIERIDKVQDYNIIALRMIVTLPIFIFDNYCLLKVHPVVISVKNRSDVFKCIYCAQNYCSVHSFPTPKLLHDITFSRLAMLLAMSFSLNLILSRNPRIYIKFILNVRIYIKSTDFIEIHTSIWAFKRETS